MNAIGIRAGYNDGFTSELNYQRFPNENRNLMLEANFGFRDVSSESEYIKIISTVQYVLPLNKEYTFYFGAGAGFGNYETNMQSNNEFITNGILGIGWSNGTLSISFSLDVTPEYRPNSAFKDDVCFDMGLSARIDSNNLNT